MPAMPDGKLHCRFEVQCVKEALERAVGLRSPKCFEPVAFLRAIVVGAGVPISGAPLYRICKPIVYQDFLLAQRPSSKRIGMSATDPPSSVEITTIDACAIRDIVYAGRLSDLNG